MENYLNLLSKTPLFMGTTPDEIAPMLGCLGAHKKTYSKDDRILRVGDITSSIGLVLEGSVLLLKEDVWGRRNILGKMKPGEFFAEPFAASMDAPLNIDIVAAEKTVVLMINVRRILTTCASTCERHSKVIRNMVSVLAKKALDFNEKIEHMGKRTTREKLLSYLSAESLRQGKLEFDIPYDRQQLADYLCVERAAMSVALSRLKKEALLDYEKSHFILKGIIEDA